MTQSRIPGRAAQTVRERGPPWPPPHHAVADSGSRRAAWPSDQSGLCGRFIGLACVGAQIIGSVYRRQSHRLTQTLSHGGGWQASAGTIGAPPAALVSIAPSMPSSRISSHVQGFVMAGLLERRALGVASWTRGGARRSSRMRISRMLRRAHSPASRDGADGPVRSSGRSRLMPNTRTTRPSWLCGIQSVSPSEAPSSQGRVGISIGTLQR